MFSNRKNEKGQGLVEYAIILALVAIVVIAAMGPVGDKLVCIFQGIGNSLDGSGEACGEKVDLGSGPLTWNVDVFYNDAEVCAAAGLSSGDTATFWGEHSTMNYGDNYYWTGSNTIAPEPGYVQGSSVTCP